MYKTIVPNAGLASANRKQAKESRHSMGWKIPAMPANLHFYAGHSKVTYAIVEIFNNLKK